MVFVSDFYSGVTLQRDFLRLFNVDRGNVGLMLLAKDEYGNNFNDL